MRPAVLNNPNKSRQRVIEVLSYPFAGKTCQGQSLNCRVADIIIILCKL